MKGYSTRFRAPELEPRHQMQLSVIPKTRLFLKGDILPFYRVYSLRILRHADETTIYKS